MAPGQTAIRATALAGLLGASAPVLAEPMACPDPRVDVEAATPALHARVCALIEDARPALSACGLTQARPVSLHVVSDLVSAPHGPACIGLYDCTTETIRVLDPEALGRAVAGDVPLSLLPADELFDSLVTHELAHAFFAQVAEGGTVQPAANQEYVAYAMQMASLSDTARAAFLETHPGPESVSRIELNSVVAQAAPSLFAAKVWRHFSMEGNGCAFVGRLIRGEVSLALPQL